MTTQTVDDYEVDFTDEDGKTYTYNIDYTMRKEPGGAYSVELRTIRDENGEEIEPDPFMDDALIRSVLEEHDYSQSTDDDEDLTDDDDLDEVNDDLSTDEEEAEDEAEEEAAAEAQRKRDADEKGGTTQG